MKFAIGDRVHLGEDQCELYEVMGYTESGQPIVDLLEQTKKVVTSFGRAHRPFATTENLLRRAK